LNFGSGAGYGGEGERETVERKTTRDAMLASLGTLGGFSHQLSVSVSLSLSLSMLSLYALCYYYYYYYY
jgi:hypothetical protein